MRKLNAFVAISILLISTINSPLLFSSIALSQEQITTTTTEQSQTTTQTTTEQPKTETQPTTTEPPPETVALPPEEKPPEVEPSRPVCPLPSVAIACGENQGLITNYDDKGCPTGYSCKELEKVEVGQVAVCPEVPPPTISCKTNEQLSKTTDDKGCVAGYNCISTAPLLEERTCPEVREKPPCDGSLSPSFDKGCLIGYTCVPSGCRQETDSSGFVRVICKQERRCVADEEQSKLKSQCYEQGGNPVPFQDQSGCTFYDCKFDNRGINTNPLSGHQECPNEEETKRQINKCQSSGAEPSIAMEGGCNIIRCGQKTIDERSCKFVSEPERIRVENECSSKGLRAISATDNNGCQYFRCAGDQQTTCQRDVPPEAYKSCDSRGGEMIVKTNDQGCIVFSNCVMQGDEKNALVSPVTEVPDTTVLLSLALKLEQLKIELQKLSTDSKEIAKYYASTGSLDEERYNRVSSMFDAAANRIDEMKSKIKSSAETMTTDDLVEIKHDIKYIKEVTLRDILYVMLSNSDDVKETLESSKKISAKSSVEEITQNAKDCGTDGMCFDRAIRSCKPVTFQPEGRNGPLISITGLNDKNCVLHVTMQSSDMIPPGYTKDTFFMDCPIADYTLGVRGPEDIIPTCEGPMAKFAKQFGGGEVTGGASFPPPEGGPGGCETEKDCAVYCIDNYDECKQWVKEHPAYGPMPSKEELRKFASGKQETIRTGPSQEVRFSGPGGCTSPQECDRFCRNNPSTCINWCDENPGMCPEEKLKQVPEEFRAGEFKQGERCECTWAAGTREHPRGCPVLCSDYSYDESACEDQARNGCVWLLAEREVKRGEEFRQPSGEKCPDGICDEFERANPNACPQDCGGGGEFERGAAPVSRQPVSREPVQACVGCLNNGVCDIGECSECSDCLRGTRTITGEISRVR